MYVPKAKKKVKIAEKRFPIMTASAGVKRCLSLREKLSNERDEDKGAKQEGYE